MSHVLSCQVSWHLGVNTKIFETHLTTVYTVTILTFFKIMNIFNEMTKNSSNAAKHMQLKK